MQNITPTMVAYVGVFVGAIGAFVGFVGAVVGIVNSRMVVRWKRTELANTYMKDFNNSPELVFAGRCLDWNKGKLALPESLRAYMPYEAKVIQHDRKIFAKALDPFLSTDGIDDDPRIQIYRTSMDSFLTWLCLVASALDRKLFLVEDIQDVGYWVAKVQSEVVLHGFIISYGYQENIEKLIRFYRRKPSPYQNWVFPLNMPHRRISATASPRSESPPRQSSSQQDWERTSQARPPHRRAFRLGNPKERLSRMS
jgi:hypothetical protein